MTRAHDDEKPETDGRSEAQAKEPSESDNPFGDELGERVTEAIELLEAIQRNRGVLAHLAPDIRQRLLIAAGRVSRPGRNAMRAQSRTARRLARNLSRSSDREVLGESGIRATRRKATFPTPPVDPAPDHVLASFHELAAAPGSAPGSAPRGSPGDGTSTPRRRVHEARNCYQCKADFYELHHFYDSLCSRCGALNWQKRYQSADLSGRVALLTGGRVKIGYQTGIKLLRAGARLIVTTRFPRDAATRYAAESDFTTWADRLEIHGLDLRHTPSVEVFASTLLERCDRLDFIINNACQTVRRPSGFYRHLLAAESSPLEDLPADLRAILPAPEPGRARLESRKRESPAPRIASPADDSSAQVSHGLVPRSPAPIASSAALSQIPLLPDDLEQGSHIFPDGRFDADLQQIDLREKNSWRLTLAEVPTIELLEVHLVNAVAPFVLCARLKPLMLRQPSRDKHIVNVSAMEGQFYRSFKTDKHPHTNMAKASLNMMTRTSASDYIKDGVHMNSVDTGWVTDEDPAHIAERKQRELDFHPPLDIVDGAARILDPIFDGFLTGKHAWGKFFKDYGETRW